MWYSFDEMHQHWARTAKVPFGFVQIMVQPIGQSPPSTAFVLNTSHDGVLFLSVSLRPFVDSSVGHMTSSEGKRTTTKLFNEHECREFDNFILFFRMHTTEGVFFSILSNGNILMDSTQRQNIESAQETNEITKLCMPVSVFDRSAVCVCVSANSTNQTRHYKRIVFDRPPRWRTATQNILFYWTFSSQISRHFEHDALCARSLLPPHTYRALSQLNAQCSWLM